MANRIALNTPPLLKRPVVRRLLTIALLSEIGYAVLNISTMQIYLREERHFNQKILGLVFVSFLLTEALFKGPMGHLADRFGPRMLMLIGPSMSVLTCMLSFAVPRSGGSPAEVFAFVVLRALDGIGAAMLWPAAFSTMSGAVADDERQQGMSLMNLCFMLGIALAFPIGGSVNDLFHNHWASLVVAALLLFAVAACVWRFIPNMEVPKSEDNEHSASLKDMMSSLKQIPIYLVLSIVTFIGIGFPMAVFKLFPMDQFGFSEAKVGWLVFPSAIAMAIATLPMSKFGEKLGRARAIHLGMGMCAAGIWLIGLGAFIPMIREWWVVAIAAAPVGIGFLLFVPAWMASVSDIDSKRRGINLGAIMTAQGLGAIIGTPLGTALYGKTEQAHYLPFFACAICLTISWLLGLKLLRHNRA